MTEEKRRKKKLKFPPIFRKTNKAKSGHDEKSEYNTGNNSDEDVTLDGITGKSPQLKYRTANNHKGPYYFADIRLKQELSGEHNHTDAIWTMKFSICGRLLATGGQDSVVRVWVLRSAYTFFHDLQSKYARIGASADSLSSKSTSSSLASQDSSFEEDPNKPIKDKPLCVYYGHRADVLDLTWSKNFFLLSSSMDKTVRLWHISRKECLCCFQHSEFVTSITFHPRDDRYFLSGSLDGKLRLWNIPDKKVALWNEIEGVGSKLITASNFCSNGKLVVVGTYDGRCLFYDTEHLRYHTQIQVRSRHGKNAKGRKISGVDPLPGEEKLLVASNDSRIRLYNLKDHSLVCKYKGCVNNSSQIKASFNHDAKFIISGSEDHCVYIWRTYDAAKLPSGRRDKNDSYESFTAHTAVVTVAMFAPIPGLFANEGLREVGEVIVAADYQGRIKVYVSGPEL
jgi:WD40 repeat protein